MVESVIIVGSGPAAFTAAIYAGRANLKPLILEGESDKEKRVEVPGGQLMLTTDVENYPGFPKGVEGPHLMELMREQAERFGARIETAWITKVDFKNRPFTLGTEDGRSWQSKAVIISTGASAKWLGLKNERELMNRGVSGCATCDGALPIFRNKVVGVVGGGDVAVEEANFLTKYASKVVMIHRRDQLRASKIMADRAKGNPKIEFRWNSVVTDVLDVAKGKVTGVKLQDVNSRKESVLELGGLFVAIGHEPGTKPFAGHVELDEKGYVKVKGRSTYTSVPGVFAAGDCVDYVYRQAVTAAGEGCMAAIDAERWLEGH
jgi:thioredoxin reductase (NADPH)